MTELIKLTDERYRTFGGVTWGANVTHTASGIGKICSEGFLHAYTDPVLALIFNSIHAGFRVPVFWRADGDIVLDDFGTKVGCSRLTTLSIIPKPVIMPDQKVRFAIFCVSFISPSREWSDWAGRWLTGEDRSRESAQIIAAKYAADYEPACSAALAAVSFSGLKWNDDPSDMDIELTRHNRFDEYLLADGLTAATAFAVCGAASVYFNTIGNKKEKLDLIALSQHAMEYRWREK